MKRLAAFALAAILTISCYRYAEAQTIKPIILDNDPGGGIIQEITWFNRLRDSGVPVRIRGICVSACTLVLMLPKSQVCIEPTASLGFHLASVDDKSDPLITTVINRRYYPPVVLEWIKEHGPLTAAPMFMDAATVVKLGVFDACTSSQ